MKKLIILVLSVLLYTVSSAQDETITVKKSDLPENVVKDLEKKQKIEEVKEDVATVAAVAKDARSIGHEIGVAVDEALGAVTKHATTFGKTDVGKFTMAMVAFAVMKDQIPFLYNRVVGLLFGVPFIIFANCMLFWLFFRTTRQQKRVKSVEGKEKMYEYVDTWFTEGGSDYGEARPWFIGLFWVVVFASNGLIIGCIIF